MRAVREIGGMLYGFLVVYLGYVALAAVLAAAFIAVMWAVALVR